MSHPINRLAFYIGTFLCLTAAPVWSFSYYLKRERPLIEFRADPARVTLRKL